MPDERTPEEQELADAVAEYVGCSPELAIALATAFVLSEQETRRWLDEAEIEAAEDTP
jgi:hypothetical protein